MFSAFIYRAHNPTWSIFKKKFRAFFFTIIASGILIPCLIEKPSLAIAQSKPEVMDSLTVLIESPVKQVVWARVFTGRVFQDGKLILESILERYTCRHKGIPVLKASVYDAAEKSGKQYWECDECYLFHAGIIVSYVCSLFMIWLLILRL